MNDSLLQSAMRAHHAGNLAEAARLYGEVLSREPRNFPALSSMGYLYYQVGRFEDAHRVLSEAIRLNPASPEILFLLGSVLQRLNREGDALSCFDRALNAKPNFVEAHISRGAALMMLNRHEQGLQSLDLALMLESSNAAAWNTHGRILLGMGRMDEALASFGKAIAIAPDFIEALLNRGAAFAAAKRYEEAARDLEKALAHDPDLPYTAGHLCLYRLSCCDWRHYDQDTKSIAADVAAGRRAVNPFIEVLISSSMAEQFQCAHIWTKHEAPPSSNPLWRGERYRHPKIRVAYLSADFHGHATSALMAGVFETHDRSRFETVAISFGPDDESPMRARVAAAFDRFIDVRGRSDAQIAGLIREMEIDIAVDLKGYTKDHRAGILSHRPAPIQASYLGYPGTMAAPYVDYIIADSIVAPEEHRPLYSEKIVRLPDSYQCNDSRRLVAGEAPSRRDAGLPEQGFVFCCFNNNFKIAPPLFDVWMRLLHQVPQSVLWLLEDNREAMRNLKREAEARGIASGRLVFAPRVSAAEHLARHRAADLFLDTQPYGAHTTASDALWAGLPVLTVLGPTFAARVAASLLTAAGLPETIANSLPSYESMALRLARDPEALAAIKTKLAHNRSSCALFDTVRFTRHLEWAYVSMWQRFQRGEAPETFSVPRNDNPPVLTAQIPDAAISAYMQGCQFAAENRLDEALTAFGRAIAIAPHFAESLSNRGAVLLAKRNYQAALQSFNAALAINPKLAEAWNNRGNALSELGRHDEAVASYDKVLALRPDLFEAQVNRSNALFALRRAHEALAGYDRALALRPDSVETLKGRANALFELKRFEEAIAGYEAVLARDPDLAYAQGDAAFAKLQICDWRTWHENRTQATAAVRAGRHAVNPFEFLALSDNPQDQKTCAALWVADKYPAQALPERPRASARKPIKIAYLSADFRNHAVANVLVGVLEHHNRDRFETIGVSWGENDGSEMRTRIRNAFAQFIDVEGKGDSEIAQHLRDMQIDIAVDLMGFTAESRPGILGARAAPIQVNYLGFPGTMNAPFIDYLVADRIVIPEDEQRHYGERIVYLPGSFFPVDATRPIGKLPSRREAGLPESGFVFASFNNSYKFSPPLFEIWMRLLKQTDGSVLWLSSLNEAAMRNLMQEAQTRGVDKDRLIFTPFLPRGEDHLARLGLADLFLDTLPYNAHATAADALIAGLPVLTCKGGSFAGRVAASLLHAAGLPELVAESLEAYEALARTLASEPSALAALKDKLRRNRNACPFFDTAQFTRNLEAVYLQMLERQPPGIIS